MHLKTSLSEALSTKSNYLKLLNEMGLFTVEDLLLYFPRAHEDFSHIKPVSELKEGEMVTLRGFLKGIKNERTRHNKFITKAVFYDEWGAALSCVWFNQPHLTRMLPVNTEIFISGKVQFGFGGLTLQNPEVEREKEAQIHTGTLVPVYSQHDLITSKWLRNKIHPLLYLAKEFPDLLPSALLECEGLMPKAMAVREVHFPTSEKTLKEARDRLAYEELFLIQLRAVNSKKEWQDSGLATMNTRSISMDVDLVKSFFKSLPFAPTGAQKVAIYEILKDMEKPFPMMRLLEGDVGSGKTIVAFMAMLQAISAGFQVALMAPTEVLARQHYHTVQKLWEGFLAMGGVGRVDGGRADDYPPLQMLIGSMKTSERRPILDGLSDGSISMVVGTHALIQEGIHFKNLGLAVIDEQHRFGVKQRDALLAHGAPHILTMTATPIPRTLAIVAYGDQDLSVLNEMPPGRQTIITKIVPPEHRTTVNRFIADKVGKGQQVYVICPLIDESDVLEVKSVKTEYERLQNEVFPEFQVALLHGKMKSSEKELVMKDFAAGTIDILVSTSVIEVGIDVPNASIMLIEGAERFGLSQLHQFRGRVGRGTEQSYCFLYTNSNSGDTYTRLKAMVDFSDGFRLAEIDLKLRGPGEVYGIRQSGLPELKMSTLSDGILVARVRKAAQELIEEDPRLEKYPLLRALVAKEE